MTRRTLLALTAMTALLAFTVSCSSNSAPQDVTVTSQDVAGTSQDVAGTSQDVAGTPPDAQADIVVADIVVAAPQITATAEAIADEARTPLDIHQTWQHDPGTTVTIQWNTDTTEIGDLPARVWYAKESEAGGEGDALTMPYDEAHVAEGSCTNYTAFFTMDRQYIQCEVELTGLEPGTDYLFRAGFWGELDAEAGALTRATLSPLLHARTGRSKGDDAPFTFMLAGDSRGGYEDIEDNAQRIADEDVDFWFFTGDMTDTGMPEDWHLWFEAMAPITERYVMMPVEGNHEILVDLYYHLYALPQEEGLPEGMEENAWSIVYGHTLFIGLNSLTADTIQAQKAWLDARLAEAADDPEITWRIVLFHHAAYSASNHGSNAHVQEHWVPIFDKYGVDLALTGHDHDYERSFPIRGDEKVADGEGTVYVVTGSFFSPPYSNGHEWWTAVSHHGDVGNYAIVNIDGPTLTFTAYSGDGNEVLDTFTLQK